MMRTSLKHAVAAAIGSLLIGFAGIAGAGEAILFDGNNCSGEYRMVHGSIPDFNQIGFDNDANSLMVIDGTFRFYRDANYQENNGPSIQLGPSGFQNTCWQLGQGNLANFPVDRMSAVQLVQEGGPNPPAGVAILYDNQNFGGQFRVLTRNVTDFNEIGFDNDAEAIRVLSGTWTFYRNANFGAPPDRPSITLGAGDYPNVAQVPGYPANHFPGDLMSSAQVVADAAPPPPPPPPEPVQCAAGEVQGDTTCLPCAQFNAVPNATGEQCVCGPGMEADPAGRFGRHHGGILSAGPSTTAMRRGRRRWGDPMRAVRQLWFGAQPGRRQLRVCAGA